MAEAVGMEDARSSSSSEVKGTSVDAIRSVLQTLSTY